MLILSKYWTDQFPPEHWSELIHQDGTYYSLVHKNYARKMGTRGVINGFYMTIDQNCSVANEYSFDSNVISVLFWLKFGLDEGYIRVN